MSNPVHAFNRMMIGAIRRAGSGMLPFADAVTADLPLGRLLRLTLFQVAGGMAMVMLVGTLNRVMIVELGVPAALVAGLIALPVLAAPFRAFVGYKSDHHVSALGWRRVPYIWWGSIMMFGGFAIMPFALLLLSGDGWGPYPYPAGIMGATLAFLLVGAGVHITQTAGLALATDIAPEESRPRVVALMYMMQLVGMVGTGLIFGWLLQDFTATRLVQVVQGAAVVSAVLHLIALWKQEARNPALTTGAGRTDSFATLWRRFTATPRAKRFLWAVGLGTFGFTMQDVILEPYGAEVLGMTVSETTLLSAMTAAGGLVAFVLAARILKRGFDAYRLAALGMLVGMLAFTAVVMAGPLQSKLVFQLGAMLIGFGGGFFAVGTLTAAMSLEKLAGAGLALGAWGAVQATAAGLGMGAGGAMRDVIGQLAGMGVLGKALSAPTTGYMFVYHFELLMLFLGLAVIGPLAGYRKAEEEQGNANFGLSEFPR
jgi:BCD family chlorophyll transporter-like MFS transporter